MSLRSLATRHPVPAAIACALLQFALTIAILEAGIQWLPHEAFGKVKLLAFASTILLPLGLVQALGLWRSIGLGFNGLRPAFFFIGLLVCVPNLLQGIDLHARDSVGGEVLMQFVNAFGEELLFRGVIFALLIRLLPWRALLLNGLLFGAMHLIHGVMDGDWAAAMHQALVTTAGGLLFVSVRQRTGSLWCAIVLHMLVNLSIIFSNVGNALGDGSTDIAQNIAIVLELAIAAWAAFSPLTPAHAVELAPPIDQPA